MTSGRRFNQASGPPALARPSPGDSVVIEPNLGEIRAELAAVRGRIRDLERQLAAIVSSPTWARTRRLRDWKDTLTSGPAGALLARVIRLVQIVRFEGPSGVATRVWRRLQRSKADPTATLPPVLPSLEVPPAGARPRVSIVIVASNRATATNHCLQELVARTDAGSYELIVVDDGSSDDTGRLLQQTLGIRVITNTAARGAGTARNQGAETALSDLVVFLAPDVVPLTGWVPALASTLDRDPRIGAVGAHLRYTDGRLQEAGGIVWRDGTAWSYGRGDDSYQPAYAHVRDVDFCSAACLLVRRSVFAELGGFDPRFASEGYDAPDPLFRLRARGYRVVYQPDARVVRLAEAPSTVDPAGAFDGLPEDDRRLFVAAHAGALAAQVAATDPPQRSGPAIERPASEC